MHKVEFMGHTGVLKKLSGTLGLSLSLRAFNVPASQNIWWNLSDWILDFCAKTSRLIMWLVYPITESLSLTHSIHKNYHFTDTTTVILRGNGPCNTSSNPGEGFCLVVFYSISTVVGHLKPNLVNRYIYWI